MSESKSWATVNYMTRDQLLDLTPLFVGCYSKWLAFLKIVNHRYSSIDTPSWS